MNHQAGPHAVTTARPVEQSIVAVHDLAPMQLGMLYHALEAGADRLYTVLLGYRLEGPLDEQAFAQAWQRAARHHEILRTAFVWERVQRPRQVVLRDVDLAVEFLDWSDRPAPERDRLLAARYERERAATFDLSKPPLMRLCLVRLAEGVHEFVWSLHHVVLDGWSMTRLLTEVFEDYTALRAGGQPPLRTPTPYGSYIDWLGRQDLAAGDEFWRCKLDGLAPPPRLGSGAAGDGACGASQERHDGSGQVEGELDGDTVARLHEAGAAIGVTLGSMVHAAWALQLARLTMRGEVTFGTVVWGRPLDLPGADEIIGPCMNTLPVRVPVPPGERLDTWVSALGADLLAGREHGHVPLARIRSLADLPPGRPLFESVVAFQRFAGMQRLSGAIEDLAVRETVSAQHVHFPLALEVGAGASAQLRLLHDPDRFPAGTAQRLLDELANRMRHLPDQLQGPVSAAVVPPGEAPARRGATSAGVTESIVPVVELVGTHARTRPNAPAVQEPGRSATYSELASTADAVASWLASRDVDRGDLVGVVLPRGVDLVAAQLGVMRAGAAFLPLDPDDAPERLAGMLARAGARAIVTTAALEEALPPVVPHLLRAGRDLLATDTPGATGAPAASRVGGDDLAYGIHTSGSTGEPKCVGVEHAGLANLAAWTRRRFGLTHEDRCGVLCNPAFDGSVWEIWACLAAGGSLHVAPAETRLDPEALRDWLVSTGVTVTFVPTALVEPLITLTWPPTARLRTVLTGGEALTRRPPPGLPFTLVNNYGVAEASVVQTSATVPPLDEASGPVGIGQAVDGMHVVLVDGTGRPVAGGEIGELCVGGTGVARGYLRRPGATAERFVPDPHAQRPGARLYRTGDLARQLPDGSLQYAGRSDEQVQVRGYRVEVGEVEAILGGHPGVAQAVVHGRRVSGDTPVVLEAHVVPAAAQPTPPELHRHLAQRLPAHMVPTRYAFLDALPVTANGKIDRAALPPAQPLRADGEQGHVAPRTDAERTIAGVVGAVLGVERVGVHDDLFELGCDSISSIQIVARCGQAGLAMSVRDLFDHLTVAGLAAALTARAARPVASQAPATAPPGAPAGAGPVPDLSRTPTPVGAAADGTGSCLWPLRAVVGVPLFVVHPISGKAGCYAPLAAHLGEDQPVYGLQEPEGEPGGAPRTIEEMAATYVEAVLAVHPEGPYLLAGWSFGGLVATAMAAHLRAGGRDVGLLALIDTPAPTVARHLPDYDPKRAAALVRRELKRRAGGSDLDLSGGAAAWASSVEADYRRRIEAARAYQPASSPVPALLLRAGDAAAGRRFLPRRVRRQMADPAFGWGGLAGPPAEIRTLPGTHDALLSEPNVRTLAAVLAQHIRQAAGGSGPTPDQVPAGGSTCTRQPRPKDRPGAPGPRAKAGTEMAAIMFESVTKRFGETVALDELSLEIPQGEIVAVLGPNGAGKTTAVSLMVGLRAPSDGRVRVLGADPRDRDVRARCGVMLQDARLPESLRCRELVSLFRSYYPDPLDTGAALELAGLTEQADEFAGRLSGGQRQRLQYALAICGRPRLLFLDEPTVGMDVGSRRAFLAEVGRFAESGATIVLTTHYLDEADQLAGRVVVVDRGRIIADAPPSVLKAEVPSRQVAFDWSGPDLPEVDGMPPESITVSGGRARLLSNEPERTVASLVAAGHVLPNLEVRGADLEDAFVALTSRSTQQETV